MRPGIDSAAGLDGLASSASRRARGQENRWPLLASVSFVIVFNIVAWGSIALGLYAII